MPISNIVSFYDNFEALVYTNNSVGMITSTRIKIVTGIIISQENLPKDTLCGTYQNPLPNMLGWQKEDLCDWLNESGERHIHIQ